MFLDSFGLIMFFCFFINKFDTAFVGVIFDIKLVLVRFIYIFETLH